MNTDSDEAALVIVRVHWIVRVLFSVGLILAGITLYEVIGNPSWRAIPRLITEVLIDFGLFKLSSSYIKITHEYISVAVLYGTFKICWLEVRKIRISGSLIGFLGDDKRVIIALSLANKQSKKLIEIIYEQAQKYKIDIAPLKAGEVMPLTHLNSKQ